MHTQLAAAAARNRGPFTRRQALSLGYSPKAIDYRIQSGRWIALRRGIYVDNETLHGCVADAAGRHALDVTAAMLALRADGGGGSHESAARIHALAMLRKPTTGIVITCPPERTSRAARRDVRLHCATLPEAHRCRRYGAVVTSPARTVVDLARLLTYEEAVVVADSALTSRQASWDELEAVLRGCWNWPGIRRATRAVRFADAGAESVLESLARLLFDKYGLPAPQTQVLVGDDWGPIGRVDFFWPGCDVICEVDGMLKYLAPGALRAEKRRQEQLADAGYEVVRLSWDDVVNHPEQSIRRLRAAFTRRTARVAG